MATITGSTGSTITTINAGANDQNGTATALASAISNALLASQSRLVQSGQPNTTGVPTYVEITANNTVLGPAQVAAAINAAGPTTVVGSGSLFQQIIGNGSNITLAQRGGSGTIVLGDGNNRFDTSGAPTLGFNILTGAGNDTIFATQGNNTVAAGGGANVIGLSNGTNTVFLGGQDTVYGVVTGSGSETIVGGGVGTAATIFTGNSSLYFIGGAGTATVAASTGSATIFAGSGGGVFTGGTTGRNSLANSAGGASTLVGAANNDTLYATGSGRTNLVAGIGNETLDGSTSTAANTFLGASNGATLIGLGSGNNTVIAGSNSYIQAGRGGVQQLISQAGRTSGLVQVAGFNPSADKFSFQGYAGSTFTTGLVGAGSTGSVGQAVSIGGVASTQVALGNGTTIQFIGVSNLQGTSFN